MGDREHVAADKIVLVVDVARAEAGDDLPSPLGVAVGIVDRVQGVFGLGVGYIYG